MKKVLYFLLTVWASSQLNSRTIDVSQHGVLPEMDATLALVQLIETLKDESDVTLLFPKGVYEFYPENAYEQYRAVANHDNSLKRMAFPIFNSKNFTIDGGASTFIFHGRMIPIVIESSEQITLQNFTITWNRSFHDELKVIESDPENNWFIVEADPNQSPVKVEHDQLISIRYDWNDSIGQNILWDSEKQAPIYDTFKYDLNPTQLRATRLSDTQFRIEAKTKSAPPVGSVLITYGEHATNRKANAIHMANSSNVSIENVEIQEAGGMGIIAERCENVRLNHVIVTPAQGKLVSTRADATHFVGCKGKITVENCRFEHMLDDAINVHGAYVKIIEILPGRQLLCEISHFQQTGLIFAQPGDSIALLSRETVLPFFQTNVTEVQTLNEKRFIMTVDKLPKMIPEGSLSAENLTWYPDLEFHDNVVKGNRARSILVTTKGKVIIENNYLSSQMTGILIEGDNKFWYESGAVKDILIRNNTFENCGYGISDFYPLYVSPMLTAEQRLGEGHYHRNIRFIDNKLISFDGRMVFARSVDGLEISGNQIIFSSAYPAFLEQPCIALQYCSDVGVTSNNAQGFSKALKLVSSDDCENVRCLQNGNIIESVP